MRGSKAFFKIKLFSRVKGSYHKDNAVERPSDFYDQKTKLVRRCLYSETGPRILFPANLCVCAKEIEPQCVSSYATLVTIR